MATFLSDRRSMMFQKLRCFRFLALVGLGLILTSAVQTEAQPIFNFGHLTWQAKPAISLSSVEFTLINGFRRNAYPGTAVDGFPAVNDIITESVGSTVLSFGDLTTSPVLRYKVLSVDIPNNSILAQALEPGSTTKMTIDHTYPAPANAIFPWVAEVASCCRTNGEVNNPNKQFRLHTLVETETGNKPPVITTLTPIVELQRGINSTFSIPVTDSDAKTLLKWRLAKPEEASSNGSFVQPGPPLAPFPLTVDSVTGVVKWNTLGLPIGSLWSCQILIEDNDSTVLPLTAIVKSVLKTSIVIGGPKTVVVEDFLIRIVPGCSVPTFDPPSPLCGSTIPGTVGVLMTFPVRVSAQDPLDIVKLTVSGLPVGATMFPPLPASGNPVLSTFSWVPPAPGITVLTFKGQDSCGLEAICSITLNVVPVGDPCANNKPPEFVLPSPPCGIPLTAVAGLPFSFPVRVVDPDLGDRVTLNVLGLPPGATMSPPLPITGNPDNSTFSWIPPVPGLTIINFIATDTCGHTTQCGYPINVLPGGGGCANNAPPVFVPPSPPCGATLTATVGQPFSFPVRVVDPNLGDGVTLNVSSLPPGASMVPALPFTDNPVNSIFTWTPPAVGGFPVTFIAKDTCGNTAQCTYNLQAVEPTGDGLFGEYFIDDPILVLTRIDPFVDFDWGLGSPDPVVSPDNFSVTWTGFLKPRFSEEYRLWTLTDDGVTLEVNGDLLINDWTTHYPLEHSAPIELIAGQKYPIKMMYFELSGHAVARLFWSSPSQPKEIIPQSQLFSSATPQAMEIASLRTKVVGQSKIALAWATVTEKNSSEFEVQRAAGQPTGFLTVQVVPGHGTTTKPQQYKYTDDVAGSNVWFYRIKQVDVDGAVHYTDPVKVDVAAGLKEIAAPREFTLSQNYPNPFNPETSIKFSVKDNVRATLRVYDMIGQEVATLFDGVAEAGQYYSVKFRAENLSSGLYFYRLTAGEFTQIKKMVVVK